MIHTAKNVQNYSIMQLILCLLKVCGPPANTYIELSVVSLF